MSIQNLIKWENQFFAKISLEDAKQAVKVSEREHENSTSNFLIATAQSDADKRTIARQKMKASVAALHRNQQRLRAAQQASNSVRVVTLTQ